MTNTQASYRDPGFTAEQATRLHGAWVRATPTRATDADRAIDPSYGYDVQEERRRLAVASGEHVVGYKVGLTSPAAQSGFGVHEPIAGYLTGSSVTTGPVVSLANLIDPRAEIEFGFILSEPLDDSATEADVLGATAALLLCVEIIDSRWQHGPPTAGLLIADNSCAARVVTGRSAADLADLERAEVAVTIAGSHFRGVGANVMGHPARAVAWLAHHLAGRQRGLGRGDLVLSGTLIPPVAVHAGDELTADFGSLGRLDLGFVE